MEEALDLSFDRLLMMMMMMMIPRTDLCISLEKIFCLIFCFRFEISWTGFRRNLEFKFQSDKVLRAVFRIQTQYSK